MRFLVVRPDRIGDVILSTPVFTAIKKKYPDSHLTVMVRENVASLVRGLKESNDIDSVMIYDPEVAHAGIKGWFKLIKEIRSERFDTVIVLHSLARLAWAVFFAGVPRRIGPLSKIHSFFTYNLGKRQRRSQVRMHEAEYNLDLVGKLGITRDSSEYKTRIYLPDKMRKDAEIWLKEKGWKRGDKLIAVHPGMGGSALNWPEANYTGLIKSLLEKNYGVLLTGGPAEGDLLERIQYTLKLDMSESSLKNLIIYTDSRSRSVDFLAGLYSIADVVVAPSTGPLHIAVALEKPVVCFYPSIRVQSAKRWGPYATMPGMAEVLVSETEDMGSISVSSALNCVNKQLLSLRR